MVDALSASKYLVHLSYGANRYSLTHLKLQKLIYLAQGWSFVWDDTPLFPEDFVAWQYGPVCRVVYDYFRGYGSAEIPAQEQISDLCDTESQDTLNAVWENFGCYTAYELVELTHQQSIWKNMYPCHGVITKQNIRDYYRSTFL